MKISRLRLLINTASQPIMLLTAYTAILMSIVDFVSLRQRTLYVYARDNIV